MMIEKPDRENMRYVASKGAEITVKIYELLDKIDELEARLATEWEAGYMEAVAILREAPSYSDAHVYAEHLVERLEEKSKAGQTVCAHGNQEPMPEEFEKVFKENWKDILA